ncbi:MAG: hypothetical protein A2024_05495 [Candidatus Edwardsbacteria bacterium GWF2_54_11]|uniref:Uncharacterized protein n=1 Tax=Candidatus Edwardsbacteria bacterium GWF2_54_11 TaxID=1817851 RepID=A0A1F5RHV9_9BACT|nr:MAG: hypothetical protein A2502_07190 [Candidatus Edwardsbacteria bacterium RifOxyC12_full_54_24]OGF13990.1 MAG: hypothetical protein A2024_05495 [Candidatus Edwardsbacteria bacterium GWF2_54_11]
MKKTTLLVVSLFTLAGISLGITRERVIDKKDNMLHVDKTIQTQTLCQRLACIADKLEISAKVSFWKKNYQDAITFYHLLLKTGKSEFDDLYNLACCYGQLGDDKQAAKYLKLAVEEGFTDINHIKSDSDFEKVKNSPKFQKIMAEIIANSDKIDNSQTVRAEGIIQAAVSQELMISQDDKN